MNIRISEHLSLPDSDIEFSAIRARGAGGQNVNKVSSAVHLRFDIRASSLPESAKARLLALPDSRINKDGVIVIKAQQYRTREKNRAEAVTRLVQLIRQATASRKKRRPTRPTRSSQLKRLESKNRHGRKKALRGKVFD